ncbi:MAG: hypothetical protein KGR26_13720 [Cyanobacteria bacterium REEB65]|nr:hypothetical protein [Cyanobacteria bacterium REEB65]
MDEQTKPCRYAKGSILKTPQMGGPTMIDHYTKCSLKMQSELQKTEIYSILLQKGLEGSVITDVCPVAATGE